MKETQPLEEKVPFCVEQQVRKGTMQHIGQQRLFPGQKVWQLDIRTGMVEPATTDVLIAPGADRRLQVKTAPMCLYCTAINEANAHRKFKKLLKEFKKKMV